jgi:acetyl esterase/lipase
MSTSSTSVASSSTTTSTPRAQSTSRPTLKMQPPSQPRSAYPHPSQAATRQPLHSSIVDKLDPEFVRLYNEHIANGPAPSTDINTVRQNYSSLYRFATQNPSGVGGIGETVVPGWDKYPGEIGVRVYVPPGEPQGERKVWPVHFNFHGGGKSIAVRLAWLDL